MFELPFNITISFDFWLWFLNLSTFEMIKVVFALGAWVPLALFLFKEAAGMWAGYRKGRGNTDWQWVVLAVDIPAMFIQTPKAIEQIFAHLSGIHSKGDLHNKYWKGKKQEWFSFEVISIEGYIQFLIRTEAEFRDLVEAAIYAQYTEAEITEVEDYVTNLPDAFPNPEYDVAGIEFKLAENEAYPIRTYEQFAYNLSKDAVFSDPMAAILENFSRIGPGENLWMQLVVEPIDSSWKKGGIELAKKLMSGDASEKKKPSAIAAGLTMVVSVIDAIIKEIFNILAWSFEPAEHKEVKKEKVELTPGMKNTIEAVEEKISKIGFKSKIRLLYSAKKNVFNASRCIQGMIGAMNQFSIMSRNAIVPAKVVTGDAGFVKAYKNRDVTWKTNKGYVLNIEELATVWHFPLPFVKTPMIQRAGHKRAEPPAGLPIESTEPHLRKKVTPVPPPEPKKDEPPSNLPIA